MTNRHSSPANIAKNLFASLATFLLIAGTPALAQLPAQVGSAPLPSLAPIIKRTSPAIVGISVKGSQQQQANPLMQDPFSGVFLTCPNSSRNVSSRHPAPG